MQPEPELLALRHLLFSFLIFALFDEAFLDLAFGLASSDQQKGFATSLRVRHAKIQKKHLFGAIPISIKIMPKSNFKMRQTRDVLSSRNWDVIKGLVHRGKFIWRCD
jgi:hypothetical protein